MVHYGSYALLMSHKPPISGCYGQSKFLGSRSTFHPGDRILDAGKVTRISIEKSGSRSVFRFLDRILDTGTGLGPGSRSTFHFRKRILKIYTEVEIEMRIVIICARRGAE